MVKIDRKLKTSIMITFTIATLLVSLRLYLPIWLKGYVNDQITILENYSGQINEVDVFLWRGAYQIKDMNIYKTTDGLEKPFIAARTIDLSIEWNAILNGAIVAEIDVHNMDLNFSKIQTGKGAGWIGFVDAISPLDINRLDIHSGRLTYTDYVAEPNVHLFINEIEANIINLRQVKNRDIPLPSNIQVTGTSIGKGSIFFDGKMNILKDVPDFDLTLELKTASLQSLNDYSRAIAGVDFESGTLDIYGELAAAEGKVTGYVKPIATNVALVNVNQDSNPLDILWESLVSIFIELFENQPTDQFAMRIPIDGDLNNPEQDLWSGFLSIFSNAFGSAFKKNEDGTINFNDALEE